MRKDLEIIHNIVPEYAKVLDIGCGNGELLGILKQNKKISAMGLELSNKKVMQAVSKGISVIHGNADNDLVNYPSDSLDFAILSQTLQATRDPKEVIAQMLRIAKYAIISVPNFGFVLNRFYLGFKGRMPVTKKLPYEWYNTPNIHFCTIKDFEILIDELACKVEKKYFIYEGIFSFMQNLNLGANLFAPNAVFLISKAETIRNSIKSPQEAKISLEEKVVLASETNQI